jgi:hypothetical protein
LPDLPNGDLPMRRLEKYIVCAALLAPAFVHADVVYFLMGEFPQPGFHHDSYVLPLSDPDHIAHARALIAQGPGIGEAIATARIEPGADGINGNFLAPNGPAWNWHVTEFLGFADFTIEIYDGWPTFVEDDIDGWMQNTGGIIGFWGYTVIGEFDGVPQATIPEVGSATLLLLAAAGFPAVIWRTRRLYKS